MSKCFIKKNTLSLRQKLEGLNYTLEGGSDCEGKWIVCTICNEYFTCNSIDNFDLSEYINCGIDEDFFIALANNSKVGVTYFKESLSNFEQSELFKKESDSSNKVDKVPNYLNINDSSDASQLVHNSNSTTGVFKSESSRVK